MPLNSLYVRIKPDVKDDKFYRCGFEFIRPWLYVEVDDEKKARIEAEPMLDVSAVQPEGYYVIEPPPTPQALKDPTALRWERSV